MMKCAQRTASRLPAAAGRRHFGLYSLAKKMSPKMSDTERTALDSGGVSFEGRIFQGSPDLKELEKYDKYTKLSDEEASFLANECHELCAMLDDHEIVNQRDMSKEVWDYLRQRGFFCLKLHKEWGGKGFSAFAVSQILQFISSRSPQAGATVAVPNSLGPGELLEAYGTPEQQKKFLPKLCDGTLIPCFALTAPHSGSDAASMKEADGVVFRQQDGSLAVRVSFKKRYITLAPVAGVVGLAFHLADPEGLLADTKGREGITIALLERSHPGLRMGPRHDPNGNSFMNGTVEGEGVIVPIDSILGGVDRCGSGWQFLMEQLGEGRGISLPAAATGGARIGITGVCAYARIRKQFRVPIADMGGVQEHIARIASNGLICIAGSELVAALVDAKEHPSVLSAVMKYEATDRGRKITIDCQDVMAGSAISRGPNNLVAGMYQMIPIGITVEGANTLTRTLMIFGQGVMRGHPHLYDTFTSILKGDDPLGFRMHLGHMVKHSVRTSVAAMTRALTRPRFVPGSLEGKIKYYEAQLSRLSAQFAAMSNLCLTLGGALKREEMVSGRMADALSTIYLGYSVLWLARQRKDVEGLPALLDLSMQQLLNECAVAMDGVRKNFPLRIMRPIMAAVNSGAASAYKPPSDKLRAKVAQLVTNDTALWRMFQDRVYFGAEEERLTMLRDWVGKAAEADRIVRKAKKEKRELTAEEESLISAVEEATDSLVQVDVFPELGPPSTDPSYVRPALREYKPLKAAQA